MQNFLTFYLCGKTPVLSMFMSIYLQTGTLTTPTGVGHNSENVQKQMAAMSFFQT